MRLDCNIYFLFKKQAFNGLLKVNGIQNALFSSIFDQENYEDANKTSENFKRFNLFLQKPTIFV